MLKIFQCYGYKPYIRMSLSFLSMFFVFKYKLIQKLLSCLYK